MDIPRIAAALVPDLQESAGLFFNLGHIASTLQCIRHLFFAVNVQACFKASHCMFLMPKIGRGDDDTVEVLFRRQHLPIIFIHAMLVFILPEQTADTPAVVGGPDIAYGGYPYPRYFQARVEQHLALGAGTQQGNIELIAPAFPQHGLSGNYPGRQQETPYGCRRIADKLPTINRLST